jgi:RNA polymerase sigma factor (sigma-70 family)
MRSVGTEASGFLDASRDVEAPWIAKPKHDFLVGIEKAHGRRLRRYLAARMRNAAADVADLTQEVYLRLLRIENHETIRNPQAYLFTVASHVLHQHALRQAAAPESVQLMDVAADLASGADTDPELQVQFRQRFEELGRALFEHSPRAYATLILHRRDGVPLQQIAARFGVSYSMAKRYLAKALAYTQQCVDAEP